MDKLNSKHWVCGFHAVEATLRHADGTCIELYVVERKNNRVTAIIDQAKKLSIPIVYVSNNELNYIIRNHQGVALHVKERTLYDEHWLLEMLEQQGSESLLLILDQITDPHNLGACLRSAEAHAVSAVIVPKDNSCSVTAVVKKVAAGAVDTLPLVTVTNLGNTMKQIKKAGVWITGLHATDEKYAAKPIYECDFCGPVALVLGAEGHGMRRLTRELCDFYASIPMCGSVASLNVSVATGISLYEVHRQRKTK